MEQIEFNLLFRWFVGLGMDDPVWDASTFCHNRDRLLEADISALVLNGVIEHRKVRGLLSRDHFSVDGTLIEAWASNTLTASPVRKNSDPIMINMGTGPRINQDIRMVALSTT